MVQIKVRLDDNDHYAGGNNVKYIVMHDTGNYSDSDEGNANYFCTGERNASAHYFVDSDSITQVVKDSDGSWHCGDGYGKNGITNLNSIGIEMCKIDGIIAEATKVNTIALVKSLMAKYNVPIDRVVRHFDASGKICPRSMSSNNWADWYSFKNRIDSTQNTPVQQPTIGQIYRIRTSWKNPQSQLNAYRNLDSAKANCPSGYSVFNSIGKSVYPVVAQQPVQSSPGGKFVFLKPSVSSWKVYPIDASPISGNQCGCLNPQMFGGIEYEVLGNPQCDVYTISTQSFGTVNIYIPVDGESSFYNKGGVAPVPQPTTPVSNEKYLNLASNEPTWRVYSLGSTCVAGNEAGKLAPQQFGGLSYKIEKDLGDEIYQITTGSFGTVLIVGCIGNGGSITSNSIY